MWQDKLKEIIYLLENSEVNEIETSFWGRKYRVVKKPAIFSGGTSAVDKSINQIIDDSGDLNQELAVVETATESQNFEKILSPMPGTFYSSSTPESPQYVKIGDSVSKGDTLCIIEAMKIMNEIEAENDGIIKSILVGNGEPVEYNQALFELE